MKTGAGEIKNKINQERSGGVLGHACPGDAGTPSINPDKSEVKMRKEFYASPSYSYYFVKKYCSWAAKIVRVDGGWMAFESIDDYKIWKNQK